MNESIVAPAAMGIIAPATVRASKRQDPMVVIAEWQTVRVRTALGVQFRQTSRVSLRRPAWMPARLFRWLFRQIVIDADPIEVRTKVSR